MLRIGAEQFYHDPLIRGTNDLQELSKTHDIVSRSKTELWHRILTHYLPLYFPEADRFHRSSRSDWFLAFLERYPSPYIISAMWDAFIADAWAVVGRRVSKERLLSDITIRRPRRSACRSSRTATPSPCSAWCWPRRSLIEQRNRIEARPWSCWPSIPTTGSRHHPGIGPVNADHPGEAGDLRRFGHHRSSSSAAWTRHHPVGNVPRPDEAVEVRQRRLRRTPGWRARWPSCSAPTASATSSNATSPGPAHADLRRKAYTAIAAKMARTAHAVVKGGHPIVLFEGTMHGGRTLLSEAVETPPIGGDLVDNVQAFRSAATGPSRTVGAAMRVLRVRYGRDRSLTKGAACRRLMTRRNRPARTRSDAQIRQSLRT